MAKLFPQFIQVTGYSMAVFEQGDNGIPYSSYIPVIGLVMNIWMAEGCAPTQLIEIVTPRSATLPMRNLYLFHRDYFVPSLAHPACAWMVGDVTRAMKHWLDNGADYSDAHP